MTPRPDRSTAAPEPGSPPSAGRRRRDLSARTVRAAGLALVALTFLAAASWLGFEASVEEAFRAQDVAAPSRAWSAPLTLRSGSDADSGRVAAHLAAAGYVRAAADSVGTGRFHLAPGRWTVGRRAHRTPGYDPAGTLEVRLDGDSRAAAVAFSPARRPVPVAEGEPRAGAPGGAATDAGAAGPVDSAALEPVLLREPPGPESERRVPVPLEQMPRHLVEAVLAVEDRRFPEHAGLDLRRTLAAVAANLRAGRMAEGGSTLTQQLARTLFLSRDRTLVRKAKEATIALALERRLSKDEILAAYLNHIYLGQDDEGVAIHGVGRAARAYFGTDVTRLPLEQAALLAGLLRAPSLYDPRENPEAARRRRDLVLELMRDAGFIGERARAAAAARPLGLEPGAGRPGFAPYFTDALLAETARLLPGLDPGRAGLTVIGTLSPPLQALAERAVEEGLRELERRFPYQVGPRAATAAGGVGQASGSDGASDADGASAERLEAALVALDPRTGDVLALVGGRDYAASPFNRAVEARRQPGSVFKPVVALAALAGGTPEEGAVTLATVLRDAPLTVQTDEGPWSPRNHDGEFRGPVTLRSALAASRNVPFVRLGIEVGPGRIVQMARRLGIRSDLRPVPSLALGSSEVTLLEMTAAYATLAAGGIRARPRLVREVRGPDGRTLVAPGPDTARVAAATDVSRLTSALQDVVDWGTGSGVRDRGFYGTVAAKSGSTDEYRDAWFVGYTPDVAVGVWVGFDGGRPVGLPGNAAALPIFAGFLRGALGAWGREPPGASRRTVAAGGAVGG